MVYKIKSALHSLRNMASSYDNNEKALPPGLRSFVPSFLQSMKRVFLKRQRVDALPSASDTRPPISHAHPPTRPQLISYNSDGPVHIEDKLNTFRRITGITSATEHKGDFRPASNVGIYARVVNNEKKALEDFKNSSRLINSCLGLQLVVAAALTALGAGNGPHAVVTVFGAINTVIAGFLTYLKGSGLPNRYKFYASSWSKVREYMEQREREFERSDCVLNVEEVIRKVEDMYEEVRLDVEANEPEAYTSTGQIKRNQGLTPGPQISDRRDEFSHVPSTVGGRVFAPTGTKTPAFSSTHMSHDFGGGDWKSGFSGAKTAVSGGERFSGLAEKLHSFAGDRVSDALGQRKTEGNNGTSHFPDLDPLPVVDQRIQRAMEVGVEKIETAKHMEAKVEDALRTVVGGVEKQGLAQSNQLRADAVSEIEKERLRGVKAMEGGAERLHEAGEQRLDAAKGLATRVEDDVASKIEEERLGAVKAMEESAERLQEAGEQRLDAAKKLAARVEDAFHLGIHNLERNGKDRE